MIHILPEIPNGRIPRGLAANLERYYDEARGLLPELPDDLTFRLETRDVPSRNGAGGWAQGPSTIVLAFDENFPDKNAQQVNLRSQIFHQAFHIIQGHYAEQPTAEYNTALDNAVYEGAATVFEREHAGTNPPWGDYQSIPEATLSKWTEGLRLLPIYEYAASAALWREWSGNDSTSEAWKSYKVGTKLVDELLTRSGRSILDLAHSPSQAILADLERLRATS